MVSSITVSISRTPLIVKWFNSRSRLSALTSVPLLASGIALTSCWLFLLVVVVCPSFGARNNPTLDPLSVKSPVANRLMVLFNPPMANCLMVLSSISSSSESLVLSSSPSSSLSVVPLLWCWFPPLLLDRLRNLCPPVVVVVNHPVRLVSTYRRRRRRARLVLSKLPSVLSTRPDFLVNRPISWSIVPSGRSNFNLRCCNRCVRLSNLRPPMNTGVYSWYNFRTHIPPHAHL